MKSVYTCLIQFYKKQIAFKKVVDSFEKPTELVIVKMGDFIGSAEFISKRSEFATFICEKTDKCVKLCTLLTNYVGSTLFFGSCIRFLSQCGRAGQDIGGFPGLD